MFKLLLVGGNADLSPPGAFAMPCIPFYTQVIKNILAQPTLVQSIQMMNIPSMIFKEVPDDFSQRLSPLMTHKIDVSYLEECCHCYLEL